jgi:NADPH:quinone reductase-like Zn-dependent oxidoreductase
VRAYHLEPLGTLDGLVMSEHDIPSPGTGEVLVRVRASSINFRDLIIANGWYSPAVAPGRVPLSDAAGEIESIGPGVTRFKVGDRVVNSFFPNWFGGTFHVMPQQWVVDHDGWLVEYKVVAASVSEL